MHKSGFVNILGRPNVGKSTLMNVLVGERMSIITKKPQTTRHRIIGIVSDDNYQIVFSDTPGVINDPAYKMQELMNSFAKSTFEDADLMLFVTTADEKYDLDDPIIGKLKASKIPIFLLINKIDLLKPEEVLKLIQYWNNQIQFKETIPISALQSKNTDRLLELIVNELPEGPAYYPKDQLTDRAERFFISEIIREKILLLYEQEIPYYSEVVVTAFKEGLTKAGKPIVRINAEIYVGRNTQKSIIIGKNGEAIKKLGMLARKDIERFIEKKAHLELHVKVKDKWREDERSLRQFGYN